MRIIFFIFAFFICSNNLCAKVVDGDSLVFNNKKIRLLGIDAPEFFQTCLDKKGIAYECGQESKKYLSKISKGKLSCKKITTDKYGRDISVCHNGSENINKKMVRSGWAVAYRYYTDEYAKDEDYARKNKLGIWQGRFISPRSYRKIKK